MSVKEGQSPNQGRRRLAWVLRRVAVLIAIVGALRLTGCMEHLFYYPVREPTPLPPHLLGAESVWFTSRDGTRLHGWFIPAAQAGTQSGRAPAILHVHGNAGNITSHIGFTEYIPPAGFSLLIFDYRGYGESEGRALRRRGLIDDTHAALDALLARADVDPSRIGIYGQSLGGSIALNVMADRPEVRAAVIESAFTSWREMAASAVGGQNPGAPSSILAAILIADDHRPIDAIARIDRPILILHGDSDSIVPPSHGRRLVAAARHARLIELPGGDHNTLRDTHPQIEPLVIDFFARELGAAPASPARDPRQ